MFLVWASIAMPFFPHQRDESDDHGSFERSVRGSVGFYDSLPN